MPARYFVSVRRFGTNKHFYYKFTNSQGIRIYTLLFSDAKKFISYHECLLLANQIGHELGSMYDVYLESI